MRFLAASIALLFPRTKIASSSLWIAGPICSGTFAIFYLIAVTTLGILCALHRQRKLLWTILHQLGVPSTSMWFQQQQHMGLFSILVITSLLVLLVLECARWHLFQTQRALLLRHLCATENDDLRQSLLLSLGDTHSNHDNSSSRLVDDNLPSSWMDWATVWKRPRKQPNHDGDDNDDEENRLLENIEEWASRAEEDPLWWSRDDEDYAITRDLPKSSGQS
jgi:hypothetical protein